MSADWVEAWATVVAAIGTVGALIWQARALKVERKTRRSEIARLEGAQARTIVLHDTEAAPVLLRQGSPVLEKPVVTATLGNYGDQPVTEVIASLRWRNPAGGEVLTASNQSFVPVLTAGKTHKLIWFLDMSFEKGELVFPGEWEEFTAMFDVEVTFNDVHGSRFCLTQRSPARPVAT